jgi:hypothetical protein
MPVAGQAAVKLEKLFPPSGRRRRSDARRTRQRLQWFADLQEVLGDGADLDSLALPGRAEALAVEVLVESVDARHSRAGEEVGRIADSIGEIGRIHFHGEVPQARPDLRLLHLISVPLRLCASLLASGG